MPLYRYAHNSTGQVFDIEQLSRAAAQRLGPFTCTACGGRLVARFGKVREKHFAHKSSGECGEETYLHQLGKQTFYDTYKRCLGEGLPFTIEYTHDLVCARYEADLGHRCVVKQVAMSYDLTRYYSDIHFEKRDGAFVPDLLLDNEHHPTRKLYVEIAVTNFVSEAKKRSRHRIIEIPVKGEADLEAISRAHLKEPEVGFFNFERQLPHTKAGECPCNADLRSLFLVFRTGTCKLLQLPSALIEQGIIQREAKVAYAKVYNATHPLHAKPGHLFVAAAEKMLTEAV